MAEKPDNAEPRRRWYQYNLRTMLIGVAVLGIACAYVAHEARIVWERKAVLDEIGHTTGAKMLAGYPPERPSWMRCLLGDVQTNVVFMMPENTPPGMMHRIEEAFPEGAVGKRGH